MIADLDELYPGVEKLLENVDYLIVSRDIPGRVIKEPDLERALRQMQRRYGCRLAAATLVRMAFWPGMGSSCTIPPPTASRWLTPRAPEIFSTLALSTVCCKIGRWSGNLILPAPRRP